MLEELFYFMMNTVVYIGVFLLSRYVFLEPGIRDARGRKIFFTISTLLFVAASVIGGHDLGQLVVLLMGMINIVIGRKKHRLTGALLVIPLVGMMNSILSPAILAQLLAEDRKVAIYLPLVVFGLYGVLLIIFWIKGKKWRAWFRENMQNRRPNHSEHVILSLTGTFLFVGSYLVPALLSVIEQDVDRDVQEQFISLLMLPVAAFEVAMFLLAIIVVVLILQGNRRTFYHDQVAGMQFSVIATMADIVENRDQNTGGHIKRTARYVEIVGNRLMAQNAYADTLTPQYLADMIVAAPLHDIGKVSIPDAILNKPGRLTDEEFAIMKTHAAAGRDVLQKAETQLGHFSYLDIALDMAGCHHERWDGKGYPNGMSGDDIPLCARIMAVADVFDALTSKRCYKDAMPLEKAYSIIREELGTHFDPMVAQAFLDAAPEVEEAMREFAEEDT